MSLINGISDQIQNIINNNQINAINKLRNILIVLDNIITNIKKNEDILQKLININNNNKNKIDFTIIKTDKISEEDIKELEENYPKIEGGIEVEKRNLYKDEEDRIYYGEWVKNKNIYHGREYKYGLMEQNI